MLKIFTKPTGGYTWLHPSRTWRTANNEEYYSWRKPIYTPCPGRLKFQSRDTADSPSFAPNNERSRTVNSVVIEAEENGAQVQLLHFAKDSVAVELGERVSPSKLIASCGNSGQTGWPHLHIEFRIPPKSKSYSDAIPLNSSTFVCR